MKTTIIICIILFLAGYTYSQVILTPSTILGSPDQYDKQTVNVIGKVQYLEVFINVDGNRANRFQLSDDNGNSISVSLTYEEMWLSEGKEVQILGTYYKDFLGLGTQINWVACQQIIEVDNTIRGLDILLNLIKNKK